MKRIILSTGLCLLVLLSAGWVLLAVVQQQQKKIKMTPAPPPLSGAALSSMETPAPTRTMNRFRIHQRGRRFNSYSA